ncbi:hypothetical protein BL254_05740 [Protofrankia sp. BMG5.30]|uniref:Secreted protein n=1 Tax=Protofrankia coriariae TaxID=1562887 RepID=A0ABR5F502_9ACTN|nr:hypothetical protein FrCorBMG51_09085 [Protofrankia coriariae]ONH36744.1 hypothetical protein BL254_05740 [Protofrankia sp. BMG5.30]
MPAAASPAGAAEVVVAADVVVTVVTAMARTGCGSMALVADSHQHHRALRGRPRALDPMTRPSMMDGC